MPPEVSFSSSSWFNVFFMRVQCSFAGLVVQYHQFHVVAHRCKAGWGSGSTDIYDFGRKKLGYRRAKITPDEWIWVNGDRWPRFLGCPEAKSSQWRSRESKEGGKVQLIWLKQHLDGNKRRGRQCRLSPHNQYVLLDLLHWDFDEGLGNETFK